MKNIKKQTRKKQLRPPGAFSWGQAVKQLGGHRDQAIALMPAQGPGGLDVEDGRKTKKGNPDGASGGGVELFVRVPGSVFLLEGRKPKGHPILSFPYFEHKHKWSPNLLVAVWLPCIPKG